MKTSKAVKVGIFLLCGIVLFCIGLFLIGNHNQFFGGHFVVYTDFANVDTLQSGARVRVSGMDAGQVSSIQIPMQPSGKFRLKLSVDQKFRDVVRQNSVASIDTEGMVGNKFVNIALGTNQSPECGKGCTLPSQEPFEISDLLKQGKTLVNTVQGSIQDVQNHADHAIDNFAKVGGNANSMIVAMRGNVERIASNGAQITKNVNGIVTGVRDGRGTVGELLSSNQMAKNVNDTIAQAKQTSTNLEQASAKANDIVGQFQRQDIPKDVQQTVANLKDTSQEIKGAVNDFLSGGPSNENTADALRETVQDAHRTARNLASDTDAIKHNFFLRGFFHRRGFYSLNFNPTEYASSEFVKHPAKRVWLSAGDLFTTTSAGTPLLTVEGRNTIDHAVSRIVDDLPNNPIMIEGYADSNSPAQGYLAASQRAADVKQYLISRFHLNPDLIGTIALDDKPPKGVGRESWNGVCLAVLVSRD